jgi:RNA polymerase sigma-70 factor (ECF subfamily)
MLFTKAAAVTSEVERGQALTLVAPKLTFEGVYEDEVAFVWRTCLRLGVEPSIVPDVAQEVFMVVHRRLSDFDGRCSVRTWIFGIVRRVAARARRTAERKPGHLGVEDATDVDEFVAQVIDPQASAEQREDLRLVQRLLSTMDENKREVFILSELEEMTLREVADAVGANANAVASRLRAARVDFERGLAAWEASEGAP